ncbi:MAG: dTDP-4-dehydrorhamnose 3,5-epimerase [Planctomycetes bacterium]|nr:dTDP-4-dehydrorhamnose 3,5-epimerase [Planctomycetota bacterium]MCD7896704.1 dTDP-4-dehydrorhamnose 3,5-epimerase [Planctomycetaceae bacterium]
MVKVRETNLPGVVVLEPKIFGDSRGFFMEAYRKSWLMDKGITDEFVQHNLSSSSQYVLRGLHYQTKSPQAKLVRVVRGSVWDVAVDVRRGSSHFGHWFGIELSESNRLSMYVPRGFAHGFVVLSSSADFLYLCSDYYEPNSEAGIAWNCAELSIEWPIPSGVSPIISDKDAALPTLAEISRELLPLNGQ